MNVDVYRQSKQLCNVDFNDQSGATQAKFKHMGTSNMSCNWLAGAVAWEIAQRFSPFESQRPALTRWPR